MPSLKSTPASDAWQALFLAFTGIHNELALELDDQAKMPIEHYEILLMLFMAGSDGLRPSDLADRRRLSRSGATRLIDRLEEGGLVERRMCGTDRRGSAVVLSSAGEKAFAAAGRVHLAGIEARVGSRLSSKELRELQRLLQKLCQP